MTKLDERSVGIIVFEGGEREKWAQKTKVKQRSTTTNERHRGESDEWDESGDERVIDERERIGESMV